MPGYLEYRESISRELDSVKDRVRHFIGNSHWGEDGRYKEIILAEILRKVLPLNVSVATGFVMGKDNQISSQIDVIIYRNEYPVLFKISDFVVVPSESVVGIVEVKTNLGSSNIERAIKSSHRNGKLIGENIFNGIFAYDTKYHFTYGEEPLESISSRLLDNKAYLNHICFGKDFFVKYWKDGNPGLGRKKPCYSFYKLENLAFGYFISNLIEKSYELSTRKKLTGIMKKALYPVEGTKEAYCITNIDV